MHGQFFRRLIGHAGKRDAVTLEHVLRIGDFVVVGVDLGISQVGVVSLADGLEVFGLDGEVE